MLQTGEGLLEDAGRAREINLRAKHLTEIPLLTQVEFGAGCIK